MKYEFSFFDKIVATKPNPIIHDRISKEFYINYLTNHFQDIYGIHTITLKKTKSKYLLLSNSFETSLHLFADDKFLSQKSLFDHTDEKAVEFSLKWLAISKDSVISYNTHFCSENIYVHLKVQHCFEKLTDLEAKYFYYFNIFKSEIERIKISIKECVFVFKWTSSTSSTCPSSTAGPASPRGSPPRAHAQQREARARADHRARW